VEELLPPALFFGLTVRIRLACLWRLAQPAGFTQFTLPIATFYLRKAVFRRGKVALIPF